MSASAPPLPSRPGAFGSRRRIADLIGEPALHGLATAASVLAVVTLVYLAIKVFDGASPAISAFGLNFVGSQEWNPVTSHFGAAAFIYGTLVTSVVAIIIAAPLSIAIALYLTELAPRIVRRPVAILVELLAAIPSVIIGLWGIIVLAPFMANHFEPFLHSFLGWIPLFGGSASPRGLFLAIIVVTIMAVPIVTSITREVFETTPAELKEAAYALGATRWEMVRMVILPYARPGMVGASILGISRALGEAIAVTQVVGGFAGIHASLFASGDTLASRIASEFQGATSNLQIGSLFYLAAILLVISLLVNVAARLIVRRVSVS
jgi:phosphate transport system permease protein